MDLAGASATVWTLGAIQLIGLASAWLTRTSEGSRRQYWYQGLFLACLAALGTSIIVSFQMNVGGWFLSGITLALMVVAATCDFQPKAQAHSTLL